MPGPGIGSIGELLVEFVCLEKDVGNRRPSTYRGPFPSGAPGIFIDQAARQGARAVFAGAVGGDAFGDVVLDRLREAGVSDALIRVVPGAPTGTAFVGYDSDGDRHFVFNIAHSAAARFPHGQEAVAGFRGAGVDVLHVSGSALGDPAMRTRIFEVCRAVRAGGARLSIDPNVRPELVEDAGYLDVVRALIGLAAYVLPSDADAALLWPDEGFEAWSARLLSAGASVVALKRGGAGALARDAAESLARPAFAVEAVDPTGAGDTFCATFVTLHAGGAPLGAALERATAAGALAVARLGPMEGASRPADIDALLAGTK